MMMIWPNWVESCSVTMRATMSVPLPGLNGTITRIGFDGQGGAVGVWAAGARPVVNVCAVALPETATSAMAKADNPQRHIVFSPLTDRRSFWTGAHSRRQR